MGTRRGTGRIEQWPDGDWVVRQVAGHAARKTYRCPGCDHEVRPGTPHLVAWPVWGPTWNPSSGVEERRHWHPACWRARR
ncbi:MAG: hypothetical protein GEV03_08620 [Streptosporangiales bacterium]|nr:hypothetical protein [Streptosporangiales bacterium]